MAPTAWSLPWPIRASAWTRMCCRGSSSRFSLQKNGEVWVWAYRSATGSWNPMAGKLPSKAGRGRELFLGSICRWFRRLPEKPRLEKFPRVPPTALSRSVTKNSSACSAAEGEQNIGKFYLSAECRFEPVVNILLRGLFSWREYRLL